MNPYDVLGVGRKAHLKTIKAAHRRLAKKHHPDTGGDEEQFKAISLAWQILRDPTRRAKYDETGEMEEKKIKTYQDVAHDILAGIFENCLKQGLAFDKTQPLMDIIRTGIVKDLEEARKARTGLKAGVAQLKELLKRITRDDGKENVFEKLTLMHIRNNEERLGKIDLAIEAMEYLLDELQHYKSFDQVVRTVRFFRANINPQNTSTNWTGQ